jgi:regulator of protease activity HflC (stomatin/prohibitin superfamily)
MKKTTILMLLIVATIASCTYVQPNFVGVLQENYGRNGKSDFTLVNGKVSTFGAGTELFQVPLYEQRGEYTEPLHLKAADNTEFTANPTYSYKVMKASAVDVVFNNRQLGSGDKFLESVEDNLLEIRIRDIIKEESRIYTTDSLMGKSGSLIFEKHVEALVAASFAKEGFELKQFSCQLDFPNKVKAKIEQRNEVNQDLLVVIQQIEVQKRTNELNRLKAEGNRTLLTPEYLQYLAIQAWKETKQPIYGEGLPFVKSIK